MDDKLFNDMMKPGMPEGVTPADLRLAKTLMTRARRVKYLIANNASINREFGGTGMMQKMNYVIDMLKIFSKGMDLSTLNTAKEDFNGMISGTKFERIVKLVETIDNKAFDGMMKPGESTTCYYVFVYWDGKRIRANLVIGKTYTESLLKAKNVFRARMLKDYPIYHIFTYEKKADAYDHVWRVENFDPNGPVKLTYLDLGQFDGPAQDTYRKLRIACRKVGVDFVLPKNYFDVPKHILTTDDVFAYTRDASDVYDYLANMIDAGDINILIYEFDNSGVRYFRPSYTRLFITSDELSFLEKDE